MLITADIGIVPTINEILVQQMSTSHVCQQRLCTDPQRAHFIVQSLASIIAITAKNIYAVLIKTVSNDIYTVVIPIIHAFLKKNFSNLVKAFVGLIITKENLIRRGISKLKNTSYYRVFVSFCFFNAILEV